MKQSGVLRGGGRRLGLLLGTALLALCQATEAADRRPIEYTARLWQTDDGLPQNVVYAIAQTPDGYLWVGTRQGLARFDGVRFSSPQTPGALGLKQAWINALSVGADGSLWIGTESEGLVRLLDGQAWHYTRTNGLPSDQVRCVICSRDGEVWIGTEEGLAQWTGGRLKQYTVLDGLADNSIRGLGFSRGGALRVATKRGLSVRSAQGAFKSTTFGAGWNRNALRCVAEDAAGNVWAGSTDGLHCLDPERRQTQYGKPDGLADGVINALLEDRSGQLWVGTYNGLNRLVSGRVVQEATRESAFGDLVYALFEDLEGSLWVGARDGLYQLTAARFKTFTSQQGLHGNSVVSVCEAGPEGLWVGVWGGGLHRILDGQVTVYPDASLLRDSILSLAPSRDGSLWIGMDFAGGLQRFRNGTRETYAQGAEQITSPVQALLEDRRGVLWVGTRTGLRLLKDGAVQGCGPGGPQAETVNALCEDESGAIWVGTEKGLSRWRDGAFFDLSERCGLTGGVTAIFCEPGGPAWLGMRSQGLVRLQGTNVFHLGPQHGLFSEEIYEIVADDFGYFWMSCRRGIFRMRKAELEEVVSGRKERAVCTVFGKADGLVSVQCNGAAKPAAWKARDGRIWFPTIRGVTAVETRIPPNERPPRVSIEEVWADRQVVWSNQGQTPRSPIRIRPGRGEVELIYTALSLQVPEKNRFMYRLEGVDSDWIRAGTERMAHYNHLGPGTYEFRVAACNNDGIWNATGASVFLVLLPQVWQTWWFRALAAVACLLPLGAAYRLRVARLRELERLRVDIAANLHDDVGARLTKVAMITELVDQQTGEQDGAKPHVRAIAQTTREVIQAMDEIVWTINPKNDTLDHLANYIFQYAQEYFQHSGLRCRFDLPAQLPDLALSTKLRHNLFMVLKEALNNILKHAGASEVRVTLSLEGTRLSITIADNGCGFDALSAESRGEGLRNMKARLADVGGTLEVESRPGAGTVLRVQTEAK